MGFRAAPLLSVPGVDTGLGAGAGVRIYQDTTNGLPGAGVVEFYSGTDPSAVITATPYVVDQGGGNFTSVGSTTSLTGISDHAVPAPRLNLDVSQKPAGGFESVATLTADRVFAGNVELTDPPTARFWRNAAGPCGNGVFTPLTWDGRDGTTDFLPSSTGQWLTIPRSGWYLMTGTVTFAGAPGGRATLRWNLIRSGGTANVSLYVGGALTPLGGVANPSVQSTSLCFLTAGDQVCLYVFQDSGATVNTVNLDFGPTGAGLAWLRP